MALFFVSLGAWALPHSTFAATFTVTTAIDSIDACTTSNCSLRAAVMAANTNPGPDTINFSNPGQTYTLNLASGTDDAEFGDLDITDDITITGTGAYSTTIDANQAGRSIEIYPGVSATLTDLTISNGFIASGNGHGSAIYMQQSDVTLTNVSISDNASWTYGTIRADDSTITLNNVQFIQQTPIRTSKKKSTNMHFPAGRQLLKNIAPKVETLILM